MTPSKVLQVPHPKLALLCWSPPRRKGTAKTWVRWAQGVPAAHQPAACFPLAMPHGVPLVPGRHLHMRSEGIGHDATKAK